MNIISNEYASSPVFSNTVLIFRSRSKTDTIDLFHQLSKFNEDKTIPFSNIKFSKFNEDKTISFSNIK